MELHWIHPGKVNRFPVCMDDFAWIRELFTVTTVNVMATRPTRAHTPSKPSQRCHRRPALARSTRRHIAIGCPHLFTHGDVRLVQPTTNDASAHPWVCVTASRRHIAIGYLHLFRGHHNHHEKHAVFNEHIKR